MKIGKHIALGVATIAAIAAALPAGANPARPQGGTGTKPCNDGTVSWTPTTLWPPNHKMVPVTITYSDTDNDGDSTTVTVGAVTETDGSTTSNALVGDDLNGSGAPGSQQGPDATTDTSHPATAGSDPDTAATWTEDVRAERSGTDGHGGGRVYDLAVTCTDMGGSDMMEAPGEMETIHITVTVPHDQGVVK